MVLGGFFGFTLGERGVTAAVGYPVVALLGFVVGWLFYRLVMRRMAGQPAYAAVLVTVAFGLFILIGIMQVIWSVRVRDFPGHLGFANRLHSLPGGITITTVELILVVAFVACELALLAFYSYLK